ncbi:DUF4249 domain-containing protein [Hymenobacter weizhouensis]|uniref:DUF4249 domain-containing protein n=1 Tax=Hymenobacter sp. YIM 151500-1 TaxID=2987689 RepID=UPI002225DD5B|nr:DUF4249 domain-containing protein [Hymenobacter sp. YIM 151500-1]UYZ61523.1 DUF4249 domain-containing protein [Hymenobacter sp. YIM 151500-1]
MKKILSALPVALLLAGCTNDVNLPEPKHTPRIALRYVLSTTAPQQQGEQEVRFGQLYVSNSQRMFDTRELTGRPDATVEVLDAAGTVVERFKPARHSPGSPRPFSGFDTQPGNYEPTLNFAGQPGQTYTLRASLPGLESVASTLTLPAQPQLESVTFTRRAPDPNDPDEVRGRLALTLTDPAASTDYYLVQAELLDAQGQRITTLYADEDDADFRVGAFQLSNLGRNVYDLNPYADTDVNGRRFTLSSNVSSYYSCFGSTCAPPAYVQVTVLSLTPDLYRFIQSQRRYEETQENPFAEPAPLHSNIRTGYGIFGGAASTRYRVRL